MQLALSHRYSQKGKCIKSILKVVFKFKKYIDKQVSVWYCKYRQKLLILWIKKNLIYQERISLWKQKLNASLHLLSHRFNLCTSMFIPTTLRHATADRTALHFSRNGFGISGNKNKYYNRPSPLRQLFRTNVRTSYYSEQMFFCQ